MSDRPTMVCSYGNDLAWVRRLATVDAVDTAQVETLLAEGSWSLLHVGIGKGGQTTLTFGWPKTARAETETGQTGSQSRDTGSQGQGE